MSKSACQVVSLIELVFEFFLAMKVITERRQSFHVSASEQAALHVMEVCYNNDFDFDYIQGV